MHLLRSAALFFCIALLASGCDRTIRDTSSGHLTLSFRLDGEMYECESVDNYSESSMRIAYYNDTFLDIRARVHNKKDAEKFGTLLLTISDTAPLETGKKYPLSYYTGQSEDRIGEPPVYFGGFDNYRSVDGWIKLRKIKAYQEKEGFLVISGNFEFTAESEDGDRIKITGGSFDGLY